MNVYIAVVCVNVIALVNAAHDINYDTVLQILKGKPRKTDKPRIEEANGQLEKLPIISEALSKSFFVKPKIWPSDQFELLNSEDTSQYYNSKDGYSRKGLKDKSLMKSLLNGNININKYHESEEYDKAEEISENIGDSLKNILNTVPNVKRVQVYKNNQGPSIIILLGPPQKNNSPMLYNTRRKGIFVSSSEDDDDSSDSYEKNPGNPFTIHKNKYKQNWPYDHFMDGDHMNINPFGPNFANLGPTGPELFFGRKWWYFNQDDYKPIG